MDMKELLAKCDHTLLKQTATWDQVKKICDRFRIVRAWSASYYDRIFFCSVARHDRDLRKI